MPLYSRRDAAPTARLADRRRDPDRLLRAGAVLRPARRQEHLGVLRVGPRRAVVAGRPVDGGHHVQQRHAQPRHRHRAAERRRRQLGVVGVRADRRVDRVLLRADVAALRRADRSRVLRDPLLGQGRRRRARLSRGLSRPALQLHDHGHGEPGGLQDRRRAVRAAALADAADGRHA